MPASCGLEPVNLPDVSACDAELKLRHDPGCGCTYCMAPYSMPYTPGPGCGKPWCRCDKCNGSSAEKPQKQRLLARIQRPSLLGKHAKLANVIIALVAALIAYYLLTRKR
jgi:hypothetical protein